MEYKDDWRVWEQLFSLNTHLIESSIAKKYVLNPEQSGITSEM